LLIIVATQQVSYANLGYSYVGYERHVYLDIWYFSETIVFKLGTQRMWVETKN